MRQSQPPDDEAFHAYATELTGRNARLAVLVIFAATALWWPTDLLFFRRLPDDARTFTQLRTTLALLSASAYVILRWVPPARRHPQLTSAIVAALHCAAFGYVFGRDMGFTRPWFHGSFATVFSSVLLVAPLRRRVLWTACLPLGLAAGFFLPFPRHLAHPLAPGTLGLLAFLSGISVGLGHVVYRLLEHDFHTQREQERTARALADLNATLEERVREQTLELRTFAAHLETAREDERARIARELHDELGQELTALRLALTFARKHCQRDPSRIGPHFDELGALLERMVATTGHIVSDLRPRILDDLGLDASAEWLLRRTEERTGLVCQLALGPRALGLDIEVSIAAFRILQEALTNVIRHARAMRIDVCIDSDDRWLTLTVRDDGVGLPPTGAPPGPRRDGGGMGMVGMRERAEAAGGRLEVESCAGAGTTIRAVLPMARAAAKGAS